MNEEELNEEVNNINYFGGVIPVYNMEVLQGRCLRKHD